MTLRRAYPSARVAAQLRAAITVDGGDGLTIGLRGPTLTMRLVSTEPATARATLDDLLACLGAAERAAGVTPDRSAAGRSAPAGA